MLPENKVYFGENIHITDLGFYNHTAKTLDSFSGNAYSVF